MKTVILDKHFLKTPSVVR